MLARFMFVIPFPVYTETDIGPAMAVMVKNEGTKFGRE